MIKIPLTQGLNAIIDDEDARLSEYRWYAQKDPNGLVYARRWSGTVNGRQVPERLHRAVLGISDPKMIVDHINGDGLDCRRGNLRVVTALTNARNRRYSDKHNKTSPYLGVTARHGKWRARIKHEGRLVQIGTFETAELANQARIKYEEEHWPEGERWAR